MPALLTTKFRHNLAKEIQLYGSLNNYYIAVGKPTPFAVDTIPPDPTNAVQTSHIEVFENMIFGKRVTGNDVVIVVNRNDWTSGTVYDAYDHENPKLYDRNTRFYVVVNEGQSYSVFKCLNNNNGAPSTAKPSLFETAADDGFYMTADGYQWKYMYSISRSDFEKFATTNYIPVTANNDVTANAVAGSIETIKVATDDQGKLLVGTRYNAYHSGAVQAARVGGNNQLFTIEPTAASNTDFYRGSAFKITSGPGAGQQRIISEYIVSGGVKRVLLNQPFNSTDIPTEESTYEISPNVLVDGDGTNFVGRALVNSVSNTIHAIEITNKGEGYSWARAVVVSNTGIINSASNTYIQANTAVLKVIISPPGGHGSNVETELGGTQVCLSINFSTVEAGGKVVSNNDFRTISLIKNPMFANVVIGINDITGSFTVGDTVRQPRDSRIGPNLTSTSYNYAIVTSVESNQLTLARANGVFSTTNTFYGTANGVPQTTEYVFGRVENLSGSASAFVANTNSNNPSLYFDQTTTLVGTITSTADFEQDEVIYQSTHANGFVYAVLKDSNNAANTQIKVVNAKGIFNTAEIGTSSGMVYGNSSLASANVTAKFIPDLVKGEGEVLYIENITPIARSNGQSETIKVVLEF